MNLHSLKRLLSSILVVLGLASLAVEILLLTSYALRSHTGQMQRPWPLVSFKLSLVVVCSPLKAQETEPATTTTTFVCALQLDSLPSGSTSSPGTPSPNIESPSPKSKVERF